VYDEPEISTLGSESYDVISMWHVLEHVSDINQRIGDIYRLLKPGGYFIAALPNPQSWDAKHYRKYWAAWDVPRHLFHFSEKNIVQLSEKQLFKFEKSYPLNWDAYYISLVSEQYKGNKFPYWAALKNGIQSNQKGKTGLGYSSMIYFFRKKA